MDPLYRKTFDQLTMDKRRAGELRTRLAHRCAERNKEERNMKQSRNTRRPLAALIAVGVVLALTVTAFAYGDQIFQVFHMMTGDVTFSGEILEEGAGENGAFYTLVEGTVTADNSTSPVEVRDGRLYFIMNGEEIDITDQVSNETPYLYDCIGPDGLRHIFLVGGTPETPGWMEISVEEGPDGACQLAGCTAGYENEAGDLTDAPWFLAGLEQMKTRFGLDWIVSITGND